MHEVNEVSGGHDRAEHGVARVFVVEYCVLVAVLLVGETQCDGSGRQKDWKWAVVVEESGAFPQADVSFAKRYGAAFLSRVRVFSHPEEEEECEDDEVSRGLEALASGCGEVSGDPANCGAW